MTTNYRQTIEQAPELAATIAHAATPSGTAHYGDRGANATGPSDPIDNTLRQLDDLTRLMAELTDSIRFWQLAFADSTPLAPPDAIQTAILEQLKKTTSSDASSATFYAHHLTRWLLTNWADVEGHPYHSWWLESLDEWLVPMVRRLDKTPRRQRPRRCPRCHMPTMWADLEHASARCDLCHNIVRAEAWLPIAKAADAIGVTAQTIRNWINDDAIDVEPGPGRTRHVELTQCRAERDLRAARSRLGRPTTTTSEQEPAA